jgi:effector-binding domain-containing protein
MYRHTKIALLLASLGGIGALVGAVRVQDGPNLSRAQYRTDQPIHFIYRQTTTTLATMSDFIEDSNQAFEAKTKSGDCRPSGPMVFVYEGADGNPDTEFTLKIGVPIPADQKPIEGFEIVDLPKFESVSSVYCGPMSGMKDAYGQLIGELFQMGYEPTSISRETYFHFEGMDSENDITLISVGVKARGGK